MTGADRGRPQAGHGPTAAGLFAHEREPYAIRVEDLEASAQVDVAHQVEQQAEPRPLAPDWSSGGGLYADGLGGDADGD